MSAKKTSSSAGKRTNNELDLLRQQMKEMQERLDGKLPENKTEHYGIDNIRPDHYIKIMNGLRERLNLSRGKDKDPLAFTEFGEIKRVQYSQLLEILDRCEAFYRKGYFFILDEAVVKKLGYEDVNVLSKEQIENVIDSTCKTEDAFELYKFATDRQKSVIVDALVDYVRDGKDVNQNLIRLIERESKLKITEKAEEAKEYMALGAP